MSIVAFSKHGPGRSMRKYAKSLRSTANPPEKDAPKSPNYQKPPKKVTPTKVPSKRPTYTEQYNLRRPPTDKKEVLNLLREWVEWTRRPENFIAEQFAIHQGISPFYFRRLAEKDEEYHYWYWMGMAALGAKRQQMLWDGQGNAMVWNRLLHYYDYDIREHDREKASYGKEDTDRRQDIHVHIEQFPNSPLVPDKE